MAKAAKPARVDPTWRGDDDNGSHPVTELTSDRQGALSPFGDVTFPLDTIPYVHPVTEINR
ncbi:hypothetical protein [Actinokineospora diospyrosa]|uniref:Uncharacterized protein n=1 Tax=Actinokineospora diospyrosa TaxID=103728 RepID=A0ABT1IGU6_9PSEU|nr:hypothetical protein [Actinokineospora diospyrosa]MCP2271844.1 hypothetical protein [Actinokineospora diospyrosa]